MERHDEAPSPLTFQPEKRASDDRLLENIHGSYRARLDAESFGRLSTFIQTVAGIKMPPAKRIMLQSRLQKRLHALDMSDFKTYVDYVLSDRGHAEELVHMIDVVSTNKTDFFREPMHFQFLRDVVLPQHFQRGESSPIKIWSAGCSSGEEPYTIGMVISEWLRERNQLGDFSILATDISVRILRMAANAVYKTDRVTDITLELKKRYFLKSKDKSNPTVRIAPTLRHKVSFARVNFMDARYSVPENFDVIFCRNVFIYFDRPTQEQVIRKLCAHLKPGGYFFLGHSESIMNMDVPLRVIRPTVFQKE